MFGIGTNELILILIITLLIFGPSKLPDLAKSMGKAISEFRKASSGILDEEEKKEEKKVTREEELEKIKVKKDNEV
ncbi:twin-arginine translocase TatA/TatE family subunit [Desulfurobacterium atlanticum]|uniref:Sec-independent protein translocase protein TatA n=1 Tax=Desulfurobacterium atlanticum TaxID=240169 RepID=A0A238YPH6_9BACT|nr:twin-arginine translocase TatA/TatE family subunit [Desulfurobacterium atlanticum]SNR72601.1 sec-independent protein translocase protein TatA [Desulfurobacterium atlanticum]